MINIIQFPDLKGPDADHISFDRNGKKMFHFSCTFDNDGNGMFTFQIWAYDFEDAERRLQYIKNNGYSYKQVYMQISNLNLTQGEINKDKIEQLMSSDRQSLSKPVIVSKGRYILDGHHRILALYALDNNIERLSADHIKAKEIGEVLINCSFIKKVEPIETNIIIFELNDNIDETQFLQKLETQNIHIIGMGGGKLRMVTHLDYTNAMHDKLLEVLAKLNIERFKNSPIIYRSTTNASNPANPANFLELQDNHQVPTKAFPYYNNI